jgi:hypothetical protein
MRDAVATAYKVRENRARRVLDRMSYRLEKSPRRDPRAADFGLYRIVPAAGPGQSSEFVTLFRGGVAAGSRCSSRRACGGS